MNTNPEYSVVLPTYNNELYLEEAIESVLNQTFSDFELIVIDDCSTDSSNGILATYEKLDNRIKVLKNHRNIGVARSLNKGVELARGKYIARMDGDDICIPERFEKQHMYLESHPEVGLLGTQILIIDKDGTLDPEFVWEQPTKSGINAWHLLYTTPLCHPSVVMRKELLLAVNGYNAGYIN